jgi:hypothetical protein
MHFTNREQRLVDFFAADSANDRHYVVDFRANNALAVTVALD